MNTTFTFDDVTSVSLEKLEHARRHLQVIDFLERQRLAALAEHRMFDVEAIDQQISMHAEKLRAVNEDGDKQQRRDGAAQRQGGYYVKSTDEQQDIPLAVFRVSQAATIRPASRSILIITDPREHCFSAYAIFEFPSALRGTVDLHIRLEVLKGRIGAGWFRNGEWVSRCIPRLGPHLINVRFDAQAAEGGQLIVDNNWNEGASHVCIHELIARCTWDKKS